MAREMDGERTEPKGAGFYKHEGTGMVVELEDTPGIGTPLIDAYIKTGYVKISDEEGRKAVAAAKKAVEAPASEDSKEATDGDYTAKMTKRGMQYRFKGRIISKADYDKR